MGNEREHDHDHSAHHLQYFHDLCLVWPPEVPTHAIIQGHRHQLADCLFEYCFQVPANRIGSYEFSVAQLKTIQEVITLTVFSVFSVLYLGQPIRWNYVVGFALMVLAVAVIFKKW